MNLTAIMLIRTLNSTGDRADRAVSSVAQKGLRQKLLGNFREIFGKFLENF